MIVLDFKIDEKELAYSLQDPIEDEDLGYFVTTMFLMPLRMRVNDLELFEHSKTDCWSPGPIMDLATFGLQDLKNLKKEKKIQHDIIEGPGDFTFTMVDDEDVLIEFYGGYVKPCYTTIVNYDALVEAFEKYAEKVRSFLKERVPQINDHEYWGPWLRGETNSDGSKIKPKEVQSASEIQEDLTPQWYGPENQVEIFRTVKETHQNSTKAIKEINAVKTFLSINLDQKIIQIMERKIKEIKTKEEFIKLIYELSQDYYDDPNFWENSDIGSYLSALGGWTESMEGFYLNFDLKIPENIDWQLIVNMLTAAKIYDSVNETYKVEEIKTKEEFVTFLYSMSQNYYDDSNSWKNVNLADFLNALARWTENMDDFYQNFGLKIPEKIDWQAIANMFTAAQIYE